MATSERSTVYGREEFQNVDVGADMRHGHPDISDGDRLIVSLVADHAGALGRPLRIMDIGAGSGVLSEMLADRLPESRVICNDNEPALVAQATQRLRDKPNAEVFGRPFQDWDEPLDVIISWGSHHHMPHSYLDQSRRLLGSEGIFIIGDEFCPEYCTKEDAERILAAPTIQIAKGYVLASEAEVADFERDGTIPAWSQALERRRRVALWDWYKFVIDYAIERDNWIVALAEIQICMDDLITEFEEEHKLSPLIVERELELNQFRRVGKHVIGDRPPELQSFFIYEFAPSTAAEGALAPAAASRG